MRDITAEGETRKETLSPISTATKFQNTLTNGENNDELEKASKMMRKSKEINKR